MKRAAFGLLLAMMSISAPAQEEGRYTLWGPGRDSCGALIQAQEHDPAYYRVQLSWIAGFVSAGNGEWHIQMKKRGIESDFLKGTDTAALEKWVENYCRRNPLKYLSSVATKLQVALLAKVSPN